MAAAEASGEGAPPPSLDQRSAYSLPNFNMLVFRLLRDVGEDLGGGFQLEDEPPPKWPVMALPIARPISAEDRIVMRESIVFYLAMLKSINYRQDAGYDEAHARIARFR